MSGEASKLEIYLKHRKALIKYAQPITSSRENAEDIVQEAYFRFSALPTLPVQPDSYLYRTVRNLALDFVRRMGMEGRYQEGDDVPSWLFPAPLPEPEQHAQHHEQLKLILELLDRLPEKNRQAIELYRLQGLKLEEVASQMGISTATAHRLVRETLLKITLLLERHNQ